MAIFKPLGVEDKEILIKYLSKHCFNTYEYSFLTLYMWRRMCNIEYTLIDGSLIIKKTLEKTGSCFMQPLGYDAFSLKRIVLKLLDIRKQLAGMWKDPEPDAQKIAGSHCGCLFRDVEEPFLKDLVAVFGSSVKYIQDPGNFDYIYESSKLVSLSGKEYHAKKNLYNQFIKLYKHEVKNLRYDNGIPFECATFAKEWHKKYGKGDRHLEYELESILDVLSSFSLFDAEGIAVYIEGKPAGFAIGEKISRSMATVHIEKADRTYKGIYAFINKALIENCFPDVEYVNRQEDLGDESLRFAKMSYRPVRFEKKYIVDIGIDADLYPV